MHNIMCVSCLWLYQETGDGAERAGLERHTRVAPLRDSRCGAVTGHTLLPMHNIMCAAFEDMHSALCVLAAFGCGCIRRRETGQSGPAWNGMRVAPLRDSRCRALPVHTLLTMHNIT